MGSPFRLLTEHDVRRALEGEDLVALMASALSQFSSGEVVQPVRTAMFMGPERSVLGLMPAYVPGCGALGTKLVAVFNSNRTRGLPTHAATILLMHHKTGELVAIMDGSYITEARTAAVSTLAVRCLAKQPVRRLALFGAGVQARSHVRAIAANIATLEDVRVWSPSESRTTFASAMSAELGVRCAAPESAQATAERADLVVLVTSSLEPVLQRAWVAPGALVVSAGACRRDHREVDPALVADAQVFVDSRAAALVESGDIVQGIAEHRFNADHIQGELGEVLLGRVTVRSAEDDIVVFKSLGLAVEDVTAADVAYRRALAFGIGIDLEL